MHVFRESLPAPVRVCFPKLCSCPELAPYLTSGTVSVRAPSARIWRSPTDLRGGSFCVGAAVLPMARRIAAGVAPRDVRGAGSQPSFVVEAPSVAVAGQKSSLACGAVRCGRRRLRPWQV